jgi:hypothetical protein
MSLRIRLLTALAAATMVAMPASAAFGQAAPVVTPAESCPLYHVVYASGWYLLRLPTLLPLKNWNAAGGFKGKLLCGVIHGDVDLDLQKKAVLKGRTIWTTLADDKVSLGGHKKGDKFSMGALYPCENTRAYWRVKVAFSTGLAADGKKITAETVYFPNENDGRELNCKGHPADRSRPRS